MIIEALLVGAIGGLIYRLLSWHYSHPIAWPGPHDEPDTFEARFRRWSE